MNRVHNVKKDHRHLRHILLKNQSDFCLPCMVRPLTFFVAMMGATTVKSSCPHTDTNLSNNKCVYRQSTFYLMICIVYMIANLVLICKDVYEIRNNNYHLSDFSTQILVQTIMCEVYSFVILLCIAINAPKEICEKNEISIVLANCKIYGISEMLSYEQIRNLRRLTMICIIVGVLILLLHFATCLMAYSVLESVVICLTFSTMFMFGIYLILETFIGKCLFETCYAQTKYVLNERLAKEQSRHMFHLGKIANESMSILNKIQKLQRLYCTLVHTVQLFNRYVNSFTLVSVVALTGIVAHQLYLIVHLWLADEFSINVYGILLVTRFSLIFIELTVLFTTHECIKNTGNDILLYLENFPTIQMLPQEATQVELLITSIRTLQPEVTVANIVIFNLSLFGSIIGSVISYLLLALQFHIDLPDQ